MSCRHRGAWSRVARNKCAAPNPIVMGSIMRRWHIVVGTLIGIGSARRRFSGPRCTAVMAVVTIAAMPPLRAQSPETPTFHSVSSELVVLPVTVTDRSGHPVSDLPQSAFAVRDNGVPQQLRLFSSEDSPVSVGLIVDSSRSMGPKLGEVVAATVAFAKSSNPDDELFVLAFNDVVHETVAGRRFLLASDLCRAPTRSVVARARRPHGAV